MSVFNFVIPTVKDKKKGQKICLIFPIKFAGQVRSREKK